MQRSFGVTIVLFTSLHPAADIEPKALEVPFNQLAPDSDGFIPLSGGEGGII